MKIEAAPLSIGRLLSFGLLVPTLSCVVMWAWMRCHGFRLARNPFVEDPERAWAAAILIGVAFPVMLLVGSAWARRNDRRQHWELQGEVIRMYQDGALVAVVSVASVERLEWRKENLVLWSREGEIRRFKFRGVGWESYQMLLKTFGMRQDGVSWVWRWLGSSVKR